MIGFIEYLFSVVSQFFYAMGYWGMILGMFIESCCIPLPSEIILPVAGTLVAHGNATFLWANIAVALGSLAGSILAYVIGYFGGRPLVIKIIEKFGKYLFITVEHFEYAEASFNRFGNVTVFAGRLLPIVRTFISLPAGIAKMNIVKFIIYSLPPILFWNYLLIYAGVKFGENYSTTISPYVHKFDFIIVILFVLITFIVTLKFMKHYKKMKKIKAR